MITVRGYMMNNYVNYNECESNSYSESTMDFAQSRWNPGVYNGEFASVEDINEDRMPKLYSPYEGYVRGNLFPSLYQGYKNIKPSMKETNNQQQELLSYIGAYAFAAHELNLYLDNYPTDREAVKQYKKFQEEASKAIKEYERMYGPLTVTGVTAQDLTWVNEPWPWENN